MHNLIRCDEDSIPCIIQRIEYVPQHKQFYCYTFDSDIILIRLDTLLNDELDYTTFYEVEARAEASYKYRLELREVYKKFNKIKFE